MLDPHTIVNGGGILVVALVIFAESGLLFGILFPGDSLLLAAGVFAGQGHLSIEWLLGAVIAAAIIGYEVGYYFGERLGPKLFHRQDGLLFRREYVQRTTEFFRKYGPAAIVIARFIAHVRTLVSLIAGASGMDRRKYLVYNVIGSVFWCGSFTLLGYFLGSRVPNIDKYLVPFILIAFAIFYSLIALKVASNPRYRHNIGQGLREDWNYFFSRSRKK